MLLPKCTRWIERVHLHRHAPDLPQLCRTACLVHALSCMSGVTHLSLQCMWQRDNKWIAALLSLPELTAMLPKLASIRAERLTKRRQL